MGFAAKLVHLPGKPAGVEEGRWATGLAAELVHLPGKPAGVENETLSHGATGCVAHIMDQASSFIPPRVKRSPMQGCKDCLALGRFD